MKRICLHGFLGRPSDWDFIQKEKIAIDLFTDEALAETSLQSFGRYLNRKTPTGSLLMGYSLGGRLGLHALLDHPSHWRGAVIISANISAGDFAQDRAWSEKFRTEDWTKLLSQWNSQKTFGAASPPVRLEAEFSREKLARALLQWSRGRQQDLTQKIATLPLPILWVVGQQDPLYVEQAKGLKFSHPLSKIWIATESAHRVPWTEPVELLDKIQQFEETL